jgi:cytochrome c peroxidase
MRLFADPDKGNCASCHSFSPGSTNPSRSLFTDYGYDAVGVPRNRALAANADPRHFDLGLCTTAVAKAWPDSAQWCGYFKTPSLRNVAVRARFMHNGALRSLRDAVAFYATRSTDPKRWYPGGHLFDDLPAAAHANVNVNSVPLNRRQGSAPALGEADIDALVAFLGTLTDARYEKPASAAQRQVSAAAKR